MGLALGLFLEHPSTDVWALTRAWNSTKALTALRFGLGALYLALGEAGLEPRPQPVNLLVHVFDGLFLFHYFVEMHLWKFREPYFRDSLGPLYFPRAAT